MSLGRFRSTSRALAGEVTGHRPGRARQPGTTLEQTPTTAAVFVANGGRIIAGPHGIPIGHLVVVEDPFGNVLVLLDSTTGTYRTDTEGNVTGIA